MPGSYCTHSDVSGVLGAAFTTAQQAECDALIASASAYIDRATNRGWLVPPITNERYDLRSPTIFLKYRPVASVQAVQTRSQAVGDVLATLTAGVDYELFDASLGQVNLISGYYGARAVAFVSYTPNLGTVPADINQAAALIAASGMQYQLDPDSYAIKEVGMGRMERIAYNEQAVTLLVPEAARQIIDGWRLPIIA